MGYDKKINAGDVASKLLDALRQDKKNIEMDAVLKAEIDQASFDKAKKQIESIDKDVEVKVDTSKAEKKLENLFEALTEIQQKIKSMSGTDVGFSGLHSVTKQYEALKQEIYEVADAVGKSNQAFIQSQKIIRDTERALQKLSITEKKTSNTKRSSKKKTGTTIETDAPTSNYEGQAGAVKDVIQATHELAEVSKQELGQVKDKVEDAKEAYKSLGDVIGETKNKMVGVKSAEDLEIIKKENSALEDKLELLQDIAEQYANIISLRDRNRYEELNQKDMNDGLTAREEERYWELGEAIDEADRQLEEFGATYSRIILKLGNGKKIQILPDDAGLKKLDKIANEYYQGEYNGVEIADVIFERIQATTDALREQESVVGKTVASQIENNTKLISSYEDLVNIIKQSVKIAKQIKPISSPEYLQLDRDMDYSEHANSLQESIAQIKAAYQNVQHIKASQKQGLSVYKHAYGDGEEVERSIYENTLSDAEATLRGCIYRAVEWFGYTVSDVANDFTAKKIRTFVEKQIDNYFTINAADNAYRLNAETFNKPLEEAIAQIISNIIGMIPEQHKSSAQTILETLTGRPNDVNRFTLSRETNKLGGYLGLTTPDSEIQANAKKIESYEELCDIIERHRKLLSDNLIYGGTDSPGLSVEQERELVELRARLEATGGKDVWTLSRFGDFEDVDKLAEVLGIQVPQAIDTAIKANDKLIESNKEVEKSIKETTDTIKKQEGAIQEYYQSILSGKTIKGLTKGTDLNSLLVQFGVPTDQRPAIQAEFSRLVDIVYDMIANENGSEEAYNLMENTQSTIEKMIVDAGKMKDDRVQVYQDFLNFMKGIQIRYSESDKSEFGDEWKNIIKRFGSGKYKVLTKESSARGADQLYQELLELFPGLFDSEIWNESDQLKAILSTLQKARDERGNKSGGLTFEAIEYVHDAINNAIATISSNAINAMQDAISSGVSNVSAEEIIARDVNNALEQLRSSKNNETTLFSLKGVFEGDDLVEQAQEMVKTIAEASNLSLGKFTVKDDIIRVQLYNEELKVTVDQMYKLRAATEEMESAQLELVSQSFSQNVKALNENNFDTEGIQQRALAAIEKVRSSLHGLEYDLTNLETAAKNITSQDDFTKFNNQLKAAQDNIQAIKNSTVSKNSMNPLANMQRDMQNASIEIETMRLKLEKFGDIQGVAEAKKMLEEMAEAVKQYNSATDAEGQKNAYNNYSNIRSSFKAQTEYINAAKSLHDSQESAQKQTDPIKNQYQTILDLVNKINAANERMIKFQSMDGGSGLLTKQITAEQQKKLEAVEKLKAVMEQLNVGNILGADHYSLPDDIQSIGADYSQIAAFINDAGVQASLSTKEIEKLVAALVKAGDIDLSMLSEAFNSTSIKERAKQTAYENRYFSDKTSVVTDAGGNVQTSINDIERLGTASTSTKEKLESMAQAIAKNSDGAVALTKSFSQGADGIARLDFSVFDKGTNSMRNFTIELGTTTGQIAAYETTINKSLANIKSAEKQMSSIGDLLGRLEASGVNTKGENAPTSITKLLELYSQLEGVVKGETTDNDFISKLLNKSKLTQTEVEKLYRQMLQLQDAIGSKQLTDLGVGNPRGNVYQQLVENTNRVIGANQNATLEFGRFDAATNTLNASLVHANGTVENFQVHMDHLSGQMTAQQAGVNKLTTSWDRFKTGVAQAGKHLMTALVGYNAFFKVVSEVRKGIGYVKDIDLALTELKKVTNETEESYRKFLNTAAGTAGEIGSTVSDFTEATANFARLGYSMKESAEMAKTAIVYKNVADGLDTVEESTDSIISTMKAFGIESSDTMGIIDRFNEVGEVLPTLKWLKTGNLKRLTIPWVRLDILKKYVIIHKQQYKINVLSL